MHIHVSVQMLGLGVVEPPNAVYTSEMGTLNCATSLEKRRRAI